MGQGECDPLIYRQLQALKGMGRPFLMYAGDIIYRVKEIETLQSKERPASSVYDQCQNGKTTQVVISEIEKIVRQDGHSA